MICVTAHFAQRYAERAGHPLPEGLCREIREALERGSDRVRYLGRFDRNGRRACAIEIGGVSFVVVFSVIAGRWNFITFHPAAPKERPRVSEAS